MVGVYHGKTFNQVAVKPERIGHDTGDTLLPLHLL